MDIVQRDGQQSLNTQMVWYDGTEELKPGYNVCYDHTAALTEGSDGFNEKVRGRVIAKPASGNLNMYAGVVVTPPAKGLDPSGTYKGWCTIARVRTGSWLKAFTKSNMTVGNYLKLQAAVGADGFALIDEAIPATRTFASVAVCGEAVNNSSTAANALIVGIGG